MLGSILEDELFSKVNCGLAIKTEGISTSKVSLLLFPVESIASIMYDTLPPDVKPVSVNELGF